MEREEARNINDWLATIALCPNGKTPVFRLVWSSEARELRTGLVRVFLGDIFIREEVRTEEMLKYSWMPERWVLEKWWPPELTYNPELPNSKEGSHEPIYVFEDKNRKALPLNKLIVEMIIAQYMGPARSPALIKSQIEEELQKRDDYEQAYAEEVLDLSPMQSLLHSREALIVPASFPIESPNLRKKKRKWHVTNGRLSAR